MTSASAIAELQRVAFQRQQERASRIDTGLTCLLNMQVKEYLANLPPEKWRSTRFGVSPRGAVHPNRRVYVDYRIGTSPEIYPYARRND